MHGARRPLLPGRVAPFGWKGAGTPDHLREHLHNVTYHRVRSCARAHAERERITPPDSDISAAGPGARSARARARAPSATVGITVAGVASLRCDLANRFAALTLMTVRILRYLINR